MSYKIITKNLTDEVELWKYMDVAKFLSFLSKKELWLARPDTFKDKREGIFHPAMKEELDAVYERLNAQGKVPSDSEIKNSDDYQLYLISFN